MRWLIIASFILALLLSILPLPFDARAWRPEFIALLVIYWATYSPEYFGVFSAWVCGMITDIILLNALGQSTLGLIVVAYIAHLSYQRMRSYALWKQAMWALILVGIYQLFSNWVMGLMGRNIDTIVSLGTAAATAILFPFIVVVLRKIRIRFRLPS
ncbi:rod shape-determining protein MreD [Eionea flava]